MSVFEIIAILLTLSALFSYANHRFLKLPTTIGLMGMALVLSLLLVAVGPIVPALPQVAEQMLGSIDFNKTLLHGMLGFLLFAGAMHVDLSDLRRHGLFIGALATFGVVISTAVVAALTFVVLRWVGIELSFVHCLLFGALISPTDPISVLAILKSLGAPNDLQVQITGESLFNDGVGVVVFLAVVGLAGTGHGEHAVGTWPIAQLFVQEVLGGALFGLAIGWIAYRMLKSVDNYQVELLISLALVNGGYAMATRLHLSGPIAMVVAGLLIGNHGRAFAMSYATRQRLDAFWELVDEILNAVLFVLLGLELLVLTLRVQTVLAGLAVVPVVLLARALAVGLPLSIVRLFRPVRPYTLKLMTWGGLRGGISVALALSLRQLLGQEAKASTDVILALTYVVVVFAILVQGLSISALSRRWIKQA